MTKIKTPAGFSRNLKLDFSSITHYPVAVYAPSENSHFDENVRTRTIGRAIASQLGNNFSYRDEFSSTLENRIVFTTHTAPHVDGLFMPNFLQVHTSSRNGDGTRFYFHQWGIRATQNIIDLNSHKGEVDYRPTSTSWFNSVFLFGHIGAHSRTKYGEEPLQELIVDVPAGHTAVFINGCPPNATQLWTHEARSIDNSGNLINGVRYNGYRSVASGVIIPNFS